MFIPFPRFIVLLTAAATTWPVDTACGGDQWPGFRGRGDGHSHARALPLAWETRGRAPNNWSVRLPGYGQSSPVVWKERIFVTAVSGEEKERLHVLAVSLENGELLWQRDFAATQRVRDSDTVSRGAPTPVVDGDRLYASFESGDIVALSHDGRQHWQRSFTRDFGEIKGPHGYASSPILVGDHLIVQVAHAGPSYVLALDKKSGEDRWRVDHPSQTGWSTPVAFEHQGQSGVVISTAGSVRALDADSGRELWVVNGIQGNSTASPTIAGDLVVIGASTERGGGGPRDRTAARTDRPAPPATPSLERENARPLTGSLAIRLGGSGDVSATHRAWTAPRVSAGYASPVVVEGLTYFVNRAGVVQCVDVESGELTWQHRLPGQVWASPVAHEGHIVFFCREGAVVALKSDREPFTVAESQVSATDVVYGVAAIDGAWIVRTGRGLVRVSTPVETDRPDQ